MIQRIHRADPGHTDALQYFMDVHRFHLLSHHGDAHAGMRLMAGHGGGRVVQDAKDHVRLIVHGVDGSCDAAGKEGGVADKGEVQGIRVRMVHALRHGDAGPHAKAGVHHVQRRGIAQCVAADVSVKDRLGEPGIIGTEGLLHCRLDRVEGSSVRTARTEHRRADGQIRRGVGTLGGCCGGENRLDAGRLLQDCRDDLRREFSCGRDRTSALAQYFRLTAACGFSPQPEYQRILDDRIQFFENEDLIHLCHEPVGQCIREGIGRCDFQNREAFLLSGNRFLHIGVADAPAGDADGAAAFESIAGVTGELLGEFLFPADELLLVPEGKAREDNPFAVLDKPLRGRRG